MQQFVRGQIVPISANPVAVDGWPGNAVSAFVRIRYSGMTGIPITEIIDLVLAEDGIWRGEWDTINAAPGIASWVFRSLGPLKTTQEGQVRIVANQANMFATP
jgi:hypothetical protein